MTRTGGMGRKAAVSEVEPVTEWVSEGIFSEHVRLFPFVTVDVVITDRDNRFVLLRRNARNVGWRGSWATPGGRVLRNERLTDAARRITQRETGLNIPVVSFKDNGSYEIILKVQHAVTSVFSAHSPSSKVVPDDTSSAIGWFTSQDFPNSLRPAYRDILAMAGISLTA